MDNKYWLFYADPTGWIPMGNDGQMAISFSKARNLKRLEKIAKDWLGTRRGRIYMMATWTQQMSELGPRAFENYIAKYGVVIAHS